MRNKYAPNILDEEEDLNKTKIIQPAPSVRARPSSARPAKRVKQPQSVPMEQPMVVNPNGSLLNNNENFKYFIFTSYS